ncbi:MAG TPA: META domain-containing protein [Caulobacteraceae bacterium]|jgi:heat shock protein HslJ
MNEQFSVLGRHAGTHAPSAAVHPGPPTVGVMTLRLLVRPLLALALAACSAPPSSDAAEPRGEAERAAPSLYARWSVLEVNGRPARTLRSESERPEVSFSPSGYGGSTGCNSFGGMGLLVGNRWFADPAMATQQGCGELDQQESAIFTVLAGGPVLTWEGADVAVLRTADGTLRLRRLGPLPPEREPSSPPMLMAGTRWDLRTVDGAPIDPRAKQPPRLTFEADRWTLEAPCSTRSGAWRQEEGAVVVEPATVSTSRACADALAGPGEALARAVEGRLSYVVGPNGEFVLAGRDHWVVGWGDPTFGGEATLLHGQWRVASVDGAVPPASERPAELGFGPGAFAVWDGCRHSEGVAIALERRLFTHGSGAVTAANCPADPVRAKINAVVAASPRIATTADGGLALVSRAGTLRLRRTSARAFGTGVETRLRTGRAFDLMTGGDPARLTLGPGDRFTLTMACGTVQGRWRTNTFPGGSYARFGPDRPAFDCENDPTARRVQGFFMGDVHAAIGPNKDIALFVNRRDAMPARVAAPAAQPATTSR